MSKKKFNKPFIVFQSEGGDIVIGGGTGQTTIDPYPCSFEDWLIMFEGDYDFDEEIGTQNDYICWWYDQEFTADQWFEINGTVLPVDPREE